MLKVNIKKPTLWKGRYVSIRDYQLSKAINSGGMIIQWQGKKMTLSLANCKTIWDHGKRVQPQKSKTGGKDYSMIDIEWKPDNEPNTQTSFL